MCDITCFCEISGIQLGGGVCEELSRSKSLRLLTLLLFYFTQGFPVGILFYALPAWLSVNGASTPDVASLVAASALPWSLKLINGFLIDRYTFLPMGRRRIWIIGAQAMFVSTLLTGALLSPGVTDIWLLSALGFCANMAVAFQDVAIDSLAVDIMEEDERAKAASIMFGAQLLGISAATALGGYLLQNAGIAVGLIALAVVPMLAMLYGILIRERSGERRFPWSAGESHPRNRHIHLNAWWPLLQSAFRALYVPTTLAIVPLLLFRAVPLGAFESFHPHLFAAVAGWQISEYTNLVSSSTLISGMVGLIVGGWLIDAIGPRKGLAWAAGTGAVALIAMGLAQPLWGQGWLLTSFIITMDLVSLLFAIAVIPICMRLCSPAVAATQFTIYMALANLGRPIGAWLATVTAGNGYPEWLYWSCGIGWIAMVLITVSVRFPSGAETVEDQSQDFPKFLSKPT